MLYTIVGWVSYQMFKKKGGGGLLEGGDFFQGGAVFPKKINKNLQYLMTIKSL